MHKSVLINVTELHLGGDGNHTIQTAILSQDPSVVNEEVLMTEDFIIVQTNTGYDLYDENSSGHIVGCYDEETVRYRKSPGLVEKIEQLSKSRKYTISQHFKQFFIELNYYESTAKLKEVS